MAKGVRDMRESRLTRRIKWSRENLESEECRCVACCHNPIEVVHHPCMHSSLCLDCNKLSKLRATRQKAKCPICRETSSKQVLIIHGNC